MALCLLTLPAGGVSKMRGHWSPSCFVLPLRSYTHRHIRRNTLALCRRIGRTYRFRRIVNLLAQLVEAGEQVARLLDANRDSQDIVEAILGHSRAAAIGSIHRQDGAQIASDDLTVTVTYWGGGKGRWRPRPFMEDEKPDSQYAIAWGERTGDLFINEKAFFGNVPEKV